jgi:hypothetical protein
MHLQKLTGSRVSGIRIQNTRSAYIPLPLKATPSPTKRGQAAGAGIRSLAAELSLAI